MAIKSRWPDFFDRGQRPSLGLSNSCENPRRRSVKGRLAGKITLELACLAQLSKSHSLGFSHESVQLEPQSFPLRSMLSQRLGKVPQDLRPFESKLTFGGVVPSVLSRTRERREGQTSRGGSLPKTYPSSSRLLSFDPTITVFSRLLSEYGSSNMAFR